MPKNAEKSFECYMKAAKQEYSGILYLVIYYLISQVAICNVGISYEVTIIVTTNYSHILKFGIGVEKDRNIAFEYYMKAAEYDYYGNKTPNESEIV